MELFDPVRGVSEPDRVWCITNVSEATPDILSPLCWGVWGPGLEESWLGAMREFGVLSKKQAVRSSNPNDYATSAIYGRQAFNVDVVRSIIARLPGVDPDDLERDIMGTVREGLPKEKGAPGRLPIIAVRMPVTMLGANRRVKRVYAEISEWWRREVFDVSTGARTASQPPLERLVTSRDHFIRAMTAHVIIRMQLQAVQSALMDAATKAGDPTLATKASAGQGNTLEVTLSDDLWLLARGEFDEHEFLARWGYHGPNEGNVLTRSWREEPERVRATARAMSGRSDLVRPRDREAAAMAAGAQAQAELLAATGRAGRPMLRFVINRARNVVANLETGKAAFLMALDGCRAAARDFGRDAVARGLLADVEDVFFLDVEELQRLDAGELPQAADLIAFRRAAREEYRAMRLPSSFTGMPVPIDDAAEAAPDVRDEICGAASGGGQVKGRARVVLDPNDDIELDEGDILVCRFTDPSWAPLFTMAEALVVDLGGAASHGAVVARELGIPYVIGTEHGTRRISDGDTILVDGEQNVVRILEAVAG